jgi:hypothetical protein
MGQYYNAIILSADGKIVVWMSPQDYNNGLKLMEHSFIGNNFVSTFEYGLSPEGPYHKSRVVWAGDYAAPEPAEEEQSEKKNLNDMCNDFNMIKPAEKDTTKYRYIVNHTKKLFVDKSKAPDYYVRKIHPLPILTAEGNCCAGGDYRGGSEFVGSWARDVISVEEVAPDFEELIFERDSADSDCSTACVCVE